MVDWQELGLRPRVMGETELSGTERDRAYRVRLGSRL